MCSDPAVSRRGNRLRNINVLCSPGALSGCLLHSTLLQRAQSTVEFLRNMVADRVAVGAPWTLYFGFSAGKSPSQRHFDLLLIYSFVSVVFQEILIFLMKCESCVMPCRELLLVPSRLFVKRIIGGDLEKTCSIECLENLVYTYCCSPAGGAGKGDCFCDPEGCFGFVVYLDWTP